MDFSVSVAGNLLAMSEDLIHRTLVYRHESSNPTVVFFLTGLAASQWLSLHLQMLGVAMVTCVSFIAVLEHHFSSVDPGMSLANRELKMRRFCQHERCDEVNHAVVDDDSRS